MSDTIELRYMGRKGEGFIKTNVPTSEIFAAYADTEYAKKKQKEYQMLLDEIERRSIGYNV